MPAIPAEKMSEASRKGVDDSHESISLPVVLVFGVDRVGSERFSGREDGCVPIGDLESLGLLDGDSDQPMVDGLTRKCLTAQSTPGPASQRIPATLAPMNQSSPIRPAQVRAFACVRHCGFPAPRRPGVQQDTNGYANLLGTRFSCQAVPAIACLTAATASWHDELGPHARRDSLDIRGPWH